MRFRYLSVPHFLSLNHYILFFDEFIFCNAYELAHIDTVKMSNSFICWHQNIVSINCTDFCSYINCRLLHCFNFLIFIFYMDGWMCHVHVYDETSIHIVDRFYALFIYCVYLLFVVASSSCDNGIQCIVML